MKLLFERASTLLAAGLLAASTQAATISYGFELAFVSGGLSGQKAVGVFAVSDATCVASVCDGEFTASGPAGGVDGTLLSFGVTVDGTTFRLTDDSGYPDFPSITLSNGRLAGIDYLADGALPSLSISFSSMAPGGPLTGTGAFVDAQGGASLIGSVSAVPEPGTAWLLLGGGLSLAARELRRRAFKQTSSPARGHGDASLEESTSQ